MKLRERLGIGPRRQRQLARLMELTLVGLLFVGVDRRAFGVVVTAGIALAVTQLPAVLEQDYGLELDAGLTLWLTAAVFAHTVGVVGVPGTDTPLYAGVPGYDHLTHALSASVVAAVGYTTVRALDRHTTDIYLPRRFTFAFILLFVMAFGVFWEIVEFAVDQVAVALSLEISGFTQHGLDDTMRDLVFNTLGGVVVAAWGHAHLTDVVGELQQRLDARSGD